MDAKHILSEILGYYKYKVDNNLCTMAEMESAQKALTENMEIYGTIDDFAKFYGTSLPGTCGRLFQGSCWRNQYEGCSIRSTSS